MGAALLAMGFLVGLVGGFLSGSFGISASSVNIVMLRVFLGLPGAVAIATALPLGLFAALSGTFTYRKQKLLKYKTMLACGISGALFAVAGAAATLHVPDFVLMGGLGLMLLLFAYITYAGSGKEEKAQSFREKAAYSMAIGALAGFASGFLGIGGGIILVPLLAKYRKITYGQAIPCSLAIMLFFLVPATAAHFALGNLDLALFAALFAGAVVGAFFGARTTICTCEEEIKRRFALVLAFFGIILLFNEIILLLEMF